MKSGMDDKTQPNRKSAGQITMDLWDSDKMKFLELESVVRSGHCKWGWGERA